MMRVEVLMPRETYVLRIINDQTGTEERADYDVEVCRKGDAPGRSCRLPQTFRFRVLGHKRASGWIPLLH